MSNRPFRFVHAGDLHLDLPPGRVTEVPDHLRDLFLDATSMAVERVFEMVISEEADFLVLSGDVLHLKQAGPRALLFLVDQFNRLAEHDIAVYWAGGYIDPPEAWPSAIPLPDNVHVFPRGHVDEFTHRKDGDPLACILGTSRDGQGRARPGDFRPDPGVPFTIAVAHDLSEISALRKGQNGSRPQAKRRQSKDRRQSGAQSRSDMGINYWALGGRHARSTLFNSPNVAHYCGSPQGRNPREHGTHGCTLVQVDGDGRARTVFLPTDAMRWMNERVEIDELTTRDDLEATLRSRMQSLIEMASSIDLMISWTIVGRRPGMSIEADSLLTQLRRGSLGHELLDELRSEFGHASPTAWSVSLDVELPEVLPGELYEQDTICGDFLRAVRQYQVNDDASLDLGSYVGMTEEETPESSTAIHPEVALAEVSLRGPSERDRALRAAAILGVDLLGPGMSDISSQETESKGFREDQS